MRTWFYQKSLLRFSERFPVDVLGRYYSTYYPSSSLQRSTGTLGISIHCHIRMYVPPPSFTNGIPNKKWWVFQKGISNLQTCHFQMNHIGVSKNRGTPKRMVYDGKPYENGWFGGTIIFGNTHMLSFGDCISSHFSPNMGLKLRPGEMVSISKFGCISGICCWWFRNPANQLILVGSLSHILYIPGGWEWDFWTINSMNLLPPASS